MAIYTAIRDDFRRGIRQGDFAPGTRLPSENEIAKTYGVSRMTARQAISELALEGLVTRVHGSGTFVSQRTLNRSLSRLSGFSTEMREAGRDVETRLLKSGLVRPPEDARTE